MTEQNKYEIIKNLVDTDGNKDRAAKKIGCSRRHINRLIKGYKASGKAYFVHGNRGIQPAHTLPDTTRQDIVDLYRNKYSEANFSHYSELLAENEKIKLSATTVRSLLMEKGILSPKATRATKKRVRLELEMQKKTATSKKEINQIDHNLLLLEDAHPRRPRCAFFGEMLQMDASIHHWFGLDKAQLHIAIDDATGTIVGAYFDKEETLNGYYNVFYQILKEHGIPYMFYTDRRTVFEYKQKKSTSIEADTFTQFGYACKQLGVQIKTTSIPQAKGRVERVFQTLQSRLPIELRLASVTTIEQANAFLDSYIQKYNARFALPIDNTKSVFEKQPDDEIINLTLAILADRKIDTGHSVRFDNKYFKPVDSNGYPAYYYKGTPALVIKAFDGNLYATIQDKVYSLDEIPSHERVSRNFDFSQATEPKKRYIPSMNHPWKQNGFASFAKNQKHRLDQSFQDVANSQANLY